MKDLCSFYFYKLIGKLTVSLQFQEFNLHNIVISTTSVWCSPRNSNPRLGTFSLSLQHYGLL
jgi:hypothetical protein